MSLKKWDELPSELKTEEVKRYFDILDKKRKSLLAKRIFDVVVSFLMLAVLSPVFLILAVLIKLDSKGTVFFRQERVTRYGKKFRIFKFRTMVEGADKIGAQVTSKGDTRITRVGKKIRDFRLDEICQLIDILRGEMSFVGTRPEVLKYVEKYTPEMMATLLMPAGVTSKACVFFKDESKLLEASKDVDKTYLEEILPLKMKYNLKDIEEFSFFNDIKIMIMTVLAVLGKEYKDESLISEKQER